jgi:hypothetical protein
MLVYYYDHLAVGPVIVCAHGLPPGRLSPVWSQANACAWIVPGTIDLGGDLDDEDGQ